jgi:4-alpha-glucanotransferase
MTDFKDDNTSLRLLARANGIATSYLNYKKKNVQVSIATLRKTLCIFYGIAEKDFYPQTLLDAMRREKIQQGIQPITIAWDGHLPALWIWLEDGEGNICLTLESEDGSACFKKNVALVDCIKYRRRTSAGIYWRVLLPEWKEILFGYYTFKIKGESGDKKSFLISAPLSINREERCWGIFAPAYAIHSDKTKDIGGYTELYEMSQFVRQQGGKFMGTLPLLPLFYDGSEPDPSPYAPVSRLFSNEIFLDVDDLPGQKDKGRKIPSREDDYIQYDQVYAAKKEIILHAALNFFDIFPEGDKGYQNFLQDSPWVENYARFRAKEEPEGEHEYAYRFHLYAQYACHLQLKKFQDKNFQLYLDYPVGVHPSGFDSAEFSHLFMEKTSVGAPPDLYFSNGQNWGFSPFHPRAIERDHYKYFRATLHHYLKYAHMIRLDHVMGLYRLYCIPRGEDSKEGTYIHYFLDGFMAVLCLEAWLHNAIIIGENLGTVPEKIDAAMKRHGMQRMWVAQFEIEQDPDKSFFSLEKNMIASLNTHDMFPFSSFMKGTDILCLEKINLLNHKAAQKLQEERISLLENWKQKDNPLLFAIEGMAASQAQHVMVNLEDLWQEERPQNIPGTRKHNWSRKFPLSLAELKSSPDVVAAFAILNRYRRVS